MLTCWGTDTSDSDEDEEDTDPVEEKEDAEDGDGEWEDGSSSDDDDDDDNPVPSETTHLDMNGCVALDGFPTSSSSAQAPNGQKIESLLFSTP